MDTPVELRAAREVGDDEWAVACDYAQDHPDEGADPLLWGWIQGRWAVRMKLGQTPLPDMVKMKLGDMKTCAYPARYLNPVVQFLGLSPGSVRWFMEEPLYWVHGAGYTLRSPDYWCLARITGGRPRYTVTAGAKGHQGLWFTGGRQLVSECRLLCKQLRGLERQAGEVDELDFIHRNAGWFADARELSLFWRLVNRTPS